MALNDVPIPGQNLNQSRPLINGNFAVLNTAFSIDHVTYNSAGQGKHNKVTLPVQDPAPTFSAGDDGFYSLAYNNGTTTRNEVFIHRQTFAGTADIPSTASILSQIAASNNMSGWTYLPSGILIKWRGATTVAAGANVVVTIPSGGNNGPAFNALFWVGVTPASLITNYFLNGPSGTNAFQFTSTSGGNIFYVAIGS